MLNLDGGALAKHNLPHHRRILRRASRDLGARLPRVAPVVPVDHEDPVAPEALVWRRPVVPWVPVRLFRPWTGSRTPAGVVKSSANRTNRRRLRLTAKREQREKKDGIRFWCWYSVVAINEWIRIVTSSFRRDCMKNIKSCNRILCTQYIVFFSPSNRF